MQISRIGGRGLNSIYYGGNCFWRASVSAINIAIEIYSFEMRNNLGQPYRICIMGEFNKTKIGEGHQGWHLVGCDGWYG
jgi:hypothetical protein